MGLWKADGRACSERKVEPGRVHGWHERILTGPGDCSLQLPVHHAAGGRGRCGRHDAVGLPILRQPPPDAEKARFLPVPRVRAGHLRHPGRSEEHTSELQSLMRISYAVFCLKKKNKYTITTRIRTKQKT